MGKRLGVPFLRIVGLLALLGRSAAAQEPAAPQGPVSYWKFDETSGTTAANSVAGAPAGTHRAGAQQPTIQTTNLPPLISYPNAALLSFDGVDDGVDVPNFGNFTAFSVSVWINRTGAGPGGRQSIVSFKENGGGGFVLCINETSNGLPRIFIHQGNWLFEEDTVAIGLNTWVHLAATYQSGNLRLYVNGLEVEAGTQTGNLTIANSNTGIGARNTFDMHRFLGLIDDVRIYGRALTAPEVAVLAAGCPEPTGLTATAGASSITLNWNAPAGAQPGYTYNVKRSTVSGGPYTTIAPGTASTTYVDSAVTVGTQYYYVVSAVSAAESGDCPQVTEAVRPIAVTATSLTTNENLATATFNILLNQPLGAGQSISFTVTSSDGTEGQVSGSTQPKAASISFPLDGPQLAGTAIPITVHGEDDSLVDGAQPYTVTVTFTSTQVPPFGGFTIPPINCTNNDNDIPGVTFSRVSGLTTTEGGGTDSFTVVLNTQPTATVSLTLTNSNPAEATLSTGTLSFAPGVWDVAQTVTVTGVDDAVLDFTIPYTIVTSNLSSSDPNYNNMTTPDVAAVNLDDEVPPALPQVWGDAGGCGLTGLEWTLPLLLGALLRRRRRSA